MEQLTFYQFLLIICSLGWMMSCEPPSEIGTEYVSSDSFDLFPLDSFTVRMSTVRSDSFLTGPSERLLVGHHKDETFGAITALPFFQIGLDSTTTLEERSTIFDSLTLAFEYDGYYYFDTIKGMSLAIHQLTEEFEAEDGFFNTTTFAYDPVPLGTYHFKPKPLKGGSIEFRLPDWLGQQLYRLLIEGDEIVTEQDRFLDFLPGLVLVPEASNSSCVVGFDPSLTQMRFYYTDNSQLPKRQLIRSFSNG